MLSNSPQRHHNFWIDHVRIIRLHQTPGFAGRYPEIRLVLVITLLTVLVTSFLTDHSLCSRVALPLPYRRHLHPPGAQPPSVLHGRLGRDAFHRTACTVNDPKLPGYQVDQMGPVSDHGPVRARALPRLVSHPLECRWPHQKDHHLLVHFPWLLRGKHGRKPDLQKGRRAPLR